MKMPFPEDEMSVARQIFLKGVAAVIPSNLIRNQIQLKGSILNIQQSTVDLSRHSQIFIVGFGKAVLPMAEEMLNILDNKVERCLLSVPDGTRKQNNSRIEMFPGAKNNIPDFSAFQSAVKIVDLVKSCMDKDLLIVLISGGGSALLPYPKSPISLEEKISLIKLLSSSGASINELNLIRSKLSVVKSGGLARLCPADRILSLLLSDVLGDHLDVIASGPTYSVKDRNLNGITIVQKYLKLADIPTSILECLKANDPQLNVNPNIKVDNIIIGSNQIALKAATEEALVKNLIPVLITHSLDGEAREIGEKISILSHFISEILNFGDSKDAERVILTTLEYLNSNVGHELLAKTKIGRDSGKGICLLFGGETTVTVRGKGKGGRNQELALSAAITLKSLSSPESPEHNNITILSAGTDGIDGPCDAAGAVVNMSTFSSANEQGFDPQAYLNSNDSYNFFRLVSNGQYHIITGHTGTNVMDLVVVIVHPQRRP